MTEDIIKAMARLASKQAKTITDDSEALSVSYLYPEWKSGVDYDAGDRANYNSVLYKCLMAHTSQEDWTPDVSPSLWVAILIPDPSVVPEWIRPDSTNGYSAGDKVTHNGKTWESAVDNNVWEPGTIGTETLWVEVIV